MKPKVGKWYKYDYTGNRQGSYRYDIFKVTSCVKQFERPTNFRYVIFKDSPLDNAKEWHLSVYYWNRYVKEIDKEELMVELI